MDNKDVIAQSVMQHEGLYKLSVLLDQFKDGLRRVKMEKLIESFPNEHINPYGYVRIQEI